MQERADTLVEIGTFNSKVLNGILAVEAATLSERHTHLIPLSRSIEICGSS